MKVERLTGSVDGGGHRKRSTMLVIVLCVEEPYICTCERIERTAKTDSPAQDRVLHDEML